MVTQAPKRSAVAAAIAFTLSCIGLMIFVWTQFGGTIPFSPQGYRINALFKETGLLVPNADVRISGVNVGKVTAVQARGVNSYVTMNLEQAYAPIPIDTRAVLRLKTLLGEAYIELSPGTGSGPKFHDGGTIPVTQIQPTQALDQVLGSFDRPTQRDLQALLSGTAVALAGRGQNINNAIGNLDPAVTQLSALVGALNEQQSNIRGVINNGAIVLTTLGDRSADLQSLITAGNQVFGATAAENASLTATVNALVPFDVQLRTTLRFVEHDAGDRRSDARRAPPCRAAAAAGAQRGHRALRAGDCAAQRGTRAVQRGQRGAAGDHALQRGVQAGGRRAPAGCPAARPDHLLHGAVPARARRRDGEPRR